MALVIPRLDDRGYDDLVRDAIARIEVHTPEWTSRQESDPGITLLHLFAFMADNLLYRSNLVPERNRLKFLQLLGVSPRPAAAAEGVVTLSNERGPLQTVTLAAGAPLLAGRVPFVTLNGLDVLPVAAQPFYRRALAPAEQARALAAHRQFFGGEGAEPEFYETVPFDPSATAEGAAGLDLGGGDTVDHALWLALLARPGEEGQAAQVRRELAGKTLTLGLMPVLEPAARVLRPGGAPAAAPATALAWELSTGRLRDGVPEYLPLDARPDGDPFRELALVQLPFPDDPPPGVWGELEPLDDGVGDYPPALQGGALQRRVLGWVRVRAVESGGAAPGLRLRWAGINAARVVQRVEVPAERVGEGTGAPDQRLALVNTPVLPATVRLSVGGEPWRATDALDAAPPELPGAGAAPGAADPRVFTVDASGEIRFGDGLRGARPPRGAPIVAAYAWGGGRAGNVGAGAIEGGPLLPPGFRVTNPLPTWNGADGESVDEAERAIPRTLRHRERAVAADDFRDLVLRTPGVEIGRAEVLPLFHPQLGSPLPGAVTVLVIPRDPRRSEAPEPGERSLRAVCRHLEPRRVLTTEVHVRGPAYVGVAVAAGIEVVPGHDAAIVREAVREALRRFLSPLAGGVEGRGWPLEKAVEDRELLVQAARVEGVSEVRQLLLWRAGEAEPRPAVALTGLELPRLERVSVALGDARELEGTGAPPPRARRLPVPAVPPEC